MLALWLVPSLPALGVLTYRGARCWVDTGRWGFAAASRLRWALWGAVMPARYWWGARIEAMPEAERAHLLARETATLGLGRADSLCCPLCGAEVSGAWALAAGSQARVGPGPVQCPACDFRLDACRYCAHFLPGAPRSPGVASWHEDDITSGRCRHYKAWQSVERTTTPEMSKQLRARGWEQVRGPLPIIDSYLPPDHCSAFRPEPRRLRAGGIRWPNAHRVALLWMIPTPAAEKAPDKVVQNADENQMWLL